MLGVLESAYHSIRSGAANDKAEHALVDMRARIAAQGAKGLGIKQNTPSPVCTF